MIGAVYFAAVAGGDHISAIRSSAAIDLALILAVVAVVDYNRRRAIRRREQAATSRTAGTPGA